MKKVLSSLLVLTFALTLCANAATKATKQAKQARKAEIKKEKQAIKKEKKFQKELAKAKKNPTDVLTDAEYKEIKMQYFNADGYGNTYNCKVAKQRFCKVKDLDTGLFVLCDRETSRTQMESAKIFYKYGRCTKLN